MVQDDFRNYFVNRLTSWSDFSQVKVSLLADCALAQAGFESANFTSAIYENANNAIGYKRYIGSIWQSGGYTNSKGVVFAAYAVVTDSAGELADWIHRRATDFQDVESLNDYVTTMKQEEYFEEDISVYGNGLPQYYVQTDTTGMDATGPGFVLSLVGEVTTSLGAPFNWLLYGGIGLAVFFIILLFKPFKRSG